MHFKMLFDDPNDESFFNEFSFIFRNVTFWKERNFSFVPRLINTTLSSDSLDRFSITKNKNL